MVADRVAPVVLVAVRAVAVVVAAVAPLVHSDAPVALLARDASRSGRSVTSTRQCRHLPLLAA